MRRGAPRSLAAGDQRFPVRAADVADVVAEQVASGARLLGEVQERVRAGEIEIVHGDPFADIDRPRHRNGGALLTPAPTATNRDPRAVS